MIFNFPFSIINLLYVQTAQDNAQAHIALFKVGNSGHDLLISGVAADLLQLGGQIGQFLGMGSIVTHHVLHQGHQLFHGGVLALALAAAAAAAAAVGVGVFMAMLVQMVMVMGMFVIVRMLMGMLMGMGDTVVGVFMGVGMLVVMVVTAAENMIVMDVHGRVSFAFFLYYTGGRGFCQNIYFRPISPTGACEKGGKRV